MSEQSEAITRPYISVGICLEADNPIFYLRISNTGKTGATNLRLKIDRSFFKFGEAAESSDISKYNAFNQEIDSFPPNSEMIFSLAQGFVVFADDADNSKTPKCFTVTATYSYSNRTITEETRIDLRPYLNADVPQDATVRKLKEISKSLEKISRKP
jgi:hypothetical protein